MKIRTLLAVALLAPAVALAAPASKGAKPPAKEAAVEGSQGSTDGLSLGGFLGYETDSLAGVSLRVDGELPFRELSPQLKLSWVGSIGYSRLTKDVSFFGIGLSTTANILKVIPSARFTLPINSELSVFGDAGLGLYYARVSSETFDIFLGEKVSGTDSRVSLLMRLGVGGWYAVNPKLRVGAMLEFDPYFGDFDQNTFIFQIGAMFGM
ncbi:MAG TPA: outer membrane beta-barrel protein [Anaeromyxobacter sp.]